MCVQIHTVYKITKFPSLEFVYTHAVTGATDKYEVWCSRKITLRIDLVKQT